MEYREAGIAYSRSIVIMITDGKPNDSESDLVAVRQRITQAELSKHCAFYTMGMGDADLERLSLIAPPGRPPKHIGGPEGIAPLIEALSRSLSQQSLDPLDSYDP